MSKVQLTAVAAISLIGALTTSQARARSADAEIPALKQHRRWREQKLDKLQKQTAANTAAAASANAKADTKVSVVNASAAYPVKGMVAPSDVVVKMPNNRPTICTADDQNCIAITSRIHFDGGGYDYHPNTPATTPQRLDDRVNLPGARRRGRCLALRNRRFPRGIWRALVQRRVLGGRLCHGSDHRRDPFGVQREPQRQHRAARRRRPRRRAGRERQGLFTAPRCGRAVLDRSAAQPGYESTNADVQ